MYFIILNPFALSTFKSDSILADCFFAQAGNYLAKGNSLPDNRRKALKAYAKKCFLSLKVQIELADTPVKKLKLSMALTKRLKPSSKDFLNAF